MGIRNTSLIYIISFTVTALITKIPLHVHSSQAPESFLEGISFSQRKKLRSNEPGLYHGKSCSDRLSKLGK